MVVKCGYCEQKFSDFHDYKLHLKINHNKKTYNDQLICGQNGCPRDFKRFQTLKQHIIKVQSVSLLDLQLTCRNITAAVILMPWKQAMNVLDTALLNIQQVQILHVTEF